jgi:sugar phosphate isomerase/epimerase
VPTSTFDGDLAVGLAHDLDPSDVGGSRYGAAMGDRLVSLAAGTVLDIGPADAVEVAAAAGWPAVGLWFDPTTWTDATTLEVRRRLDATGIVALDIEPIIPGRGGDGSDGGERLLDAAATLGVPFVLMASGGADDDRVTARLTELAAYAAANAPGVRIVLEFLPIFSVSSLGQAVGIVERVDRPEVAVLVDTLHLARSGGVPADLATVDPRLLPYLQLADASASAPADLAGLRDEALYGRLLPGEGVLPLGDVLRAVPEVPVSVELRSSALMSAFPDPTERASAVLAATRSVVGSV